MSDALAISGVTSVLQSMLSNVYSGAGLGAVTVSAVAPDIVQSIVGTGADAPLRVNLFLHQVTHNAAWRNVGLPSLAADGGSRLTNQPLALDLHYLLTVYASGDGQAEALLGFSILMLHENPTLSRNQIRAFQASTGVLSTSGLADQIELIKITPTVMGREELAWLWTALKADYRPTFPFQVSVVLIQSQNPLISALPVLKHGVTAQGTLLSMITAVTPPNRQPAASLGDTVTITGGSLAGATSVLLTNSRLGIQQTVTGLTNLGTSSFQFVVPNPPQSPGTSSPTDLPAGIYLLSVQVAGANGTLSTNGLPLAIAPKITSPLQPVAAGLVKLTGVTCAPFVRTGQQVSLLVGTQEAAANPFAGPTNSLSFTFQSLQQTGGASVPVRLRVDGIDSPISAMTKTGLAFSGASIQVTP